MKATRKNLKAAFGDDKGEQVYRLIQKYTRTDFRKINDVLGGHGIEVIHGRYIDRYHQDIQAEYVNMGNTYDTTVLHDNETGRIHVTSWGDWFERHEKQRELT
jgi:hypothetical protein